MKLLQLFKPKPTTPTIDSYGQSSCTDPQEIQSVMEWLFSCLITAGYVGKSHIIWYDSDNPDPSLDKKIKKLLRRGEPIFLYRIGGRVQPAPQGCYWRMMSEYPSMRVYQLEVKELE